MDTWNVFVILALVLIPMFAGIRYCQIRANIYEWAAEELMTKPAGPDTEVEWKQLSYDGSNPVRVIALAEKMSSTLSSYDMAKLMTSAFHSQVKHLAKKGSLLMGFAFYMESRKYAGDARGV